MISKFDEVLENIYKSLVEEDAITIGQQVVGKVKELEDDPSTPRPSLAQKKVAELTTKATKERQGMLGAVEKGLRTTMKGYKKTKEKIKGQPTP